MSSRVNPTLIGLFVLGAVAVAIAAILVFGSGGLFETRSRNVLYFSGSVKGLDVGSPVMFRGVAIGEVKDIRVICDTRDLTFRIPVVVDINTDLIQAEREEAGLEALLSRFDTDNFLQLLVENGLRGQLQMQSFVTGKLFVQLDFFPETPLRYVAEGGEYQEIPTVLSKFEEVSRTLEQIPLDQLVQKLMSTLDGIERLANDPKLAASFASFDDTLRAVRDLAGKVDARMAELVSSVDGTMQEVGSLARNLDAQVDPVASEVRQAALAATSAFAATERSLAGLEQTLAAGSPERRELRRALQQVAEAARAVRVLAEALEMQPDMLLQGRPGEQP